MSGRRPTSGSLNISGNLANVSIAHGENAYAVNQVSQSGTEAVGSSGSTSPTGDPAGSTTPVGPADRDHVLRELRLLRTQLEQLRAGDHSPAVAAAEEDVDALHEQVELDRPDGGETARRLASLAAVLGGVAGVAETVQRLREAFGQLLGME